MAFRLSSTTLTRISADDAASRFADDCKLIRKRRGLRMEDSQEWQGQTEGWVVVVKDEISTEHF